jgi:ribulose 1,5-bisphosphate synthetase/thiazole synthase
VEKYRGGVRNITTINEFDVCIIGSGPAGAAVAKALTGSGLKTVILEKQKLPRYKMCSGMLFDSFNLHEPHAVATHELFIKKPSPRVDP